MNNIDLTGAQWRKSRYSAESNGCVEVATGWRKSRHSNGSGSCVEVATGWRKASHSNGQGACIEVGQTPARVVAVRDTTDRDGGMITVSPSTWRAFLADVRQGAAVRNP